LNESPAARSQVPGSPGTREDEELRCKVEAELAWDPRIAARPIGVAVHHSIVALSGCVGSYAERVAAEQAAQTVTGVVAVASDIVVKLPPEDLRTDLEIAASAAAALRHNVSVPLARLRLAVRDGWILISGDVDHWFQRNVVETVLAMLRGIQGIRSRILVRRQHSKADIEVRIRDAFRRRALAHARRWIVKVVDGIVFLEGEVRSAAERKQLENTAWQAPGVVAVVTNLIVTP